MALEGGGYQGQLKSLGGILGAAGQGLVTSGTSVDVVVNEAIIAPANPARYWLLIQNTSVPDKSASVDIMVQLGTSGFYIVLKPYGHILINHEFPWWGQVSVVRLVADGHVRAVEASVIGNG